MNIYDILFILLSIAAAVLAGYYIEACIHVRNEMKREKQARDELSITNHDWKDFKNKPW